MKKIVLRVEGGLGNQLFQYAFVRQLQEEIGGEIFFDCHLFNKKYVRELSFGNFELNKNVYLKQNLYSYIIVFIARLKYFFFKILTTLVFNRNCRNLLEKNGVINQYSTTFESFIINNKNNIYYISGNWMSEKFFYNVKNVLLKEFTFKIKMSLEVEKFTKVLKSHNSVCVHIRRGDYASSEWAEKLLICGFEYYNKSINYLNEKLENPVFYIFSNSSDDLDWIRSNYIFDCKVEYVSIGSKDYEDLFMMTNCKHFILSNSTFSWWASYLAVNSNKIVIAPSKWNNNIWDMSDIYLPNWTLINV